MPCFSPSFTLMHYHLIYMNPASAELEQRRPVWNALSELFLDTELQPYEYQWIAEVLAKSVYTEKELEWILQYEVAPILSANLLSGAGEWDGFDQDWLAAQIQSCSERIKTVADRGL